jgi:hypothetical protein
MRASFERKVVEGTIEFNEMTCCAMAHAFARNRAAVEKLKEIIPPDKLRKMAEILPTTKNMTFVPSEEMQTVYSQIAKAELERLKTEKTPDFYCDHSINQHVKALQNALKEVSPKTN